jgi:transcription initiation factor TFIID subunit 2
MTIRIHEADGTPYEHVLDIRTPFKRFEVPFNTKYKRVRRNTKRYMARQAAAQAAAEGGTEGAVENPGVPAPGELVDVGFAVEIWDSDQERENWKIAEWTEEDEQQMSGATYEWIRLDADFEWIASITFEQPVFMWVSQLQRDRDVVAQIEVSIHLLPIACSNNPTGSSSFRKAADGNCFKHSDKNCPHNEIFPPYTL